MKEILTVNSNFFASFTEGKKLLPQAEVILVLSEPTCIIDPYGQTIRQRENTHVRFAASPYILRKLAKELEGIAAESESLMQDNPQKEES